MNGLVFLSGGSGMRRVSRELAKRKLQTTHIITTFDSGGSSRALRFAFQMPAVGDIRNRLIALAAPEAAAAAEFLNRRFPEEQCEPALAMWELQACQSLSGATVKADIAEDLAYFLEKVPGNFDARGASIGNMALTGAYLRFARNLPKAIDRYARLLHVCGSVLPVCVEARQLAANLVNGATIVGQHLFRNLPAPVTRVFLAADDGKLNGANAYADAVDAILAAKVVCLSMGSFYSSIIANLLPQGIGHAFMACNGKKIFIPDTGCDPELFDLDLPGQTQVIVDNLRRDVPVAANGQLVNSILVDPVKGIYPGGLNDSVRARLYRMGLEILEKPVVQPGQLHDPVAVADALEEILVA